jgi:DNA-binding NtrC family response regulator
LDHATTGEGTGGTETILLVEDDPFVLDWATRVLSKQGYVVETAGNGEEALQIAREHPGPIHLLVTDVVMPGISGKILASQIEFMRPATRVLFVSGYTDKTIWQHGILDSGIEILQKPFTQGDLTRKVRQNLDTPTPACSVLVIDEDREIRSLFRQTLERAGYVMWEAGTSRKAQELLQANPMDLVITSWKLPDGEGEALLRILQESNSGTKIIVRSDVADGSLVINHANSVMTAFLPRRIEPEELLSAVNRHLNLGQDAAANQ